MDEDKNKQIQDTLAEYTRRMDARRQQQSDLVRELLEKREKIQQEEIMNKLNQ